MQKAGYSFFALVLIIYFAVVLIIMEIVFWCKLFIVSP